MKLRKLGKYYYYRCQIGGMDKLYPTGKKTEREALPIARMIKEDLLRHKRIRTLANHIIATSKIVATQELDKGILSSMLSKIESAAMAEAAEVINAYLPSRPITAAEIWQRYRRNGEKGKESTEKSREQRLDVFIKWAGERDLRDFSEIDVMQFLGTLTCKAITKKHYISDIAVVWRMAPELPKDLWKVEYAGKVTVSHKKPLSLENIRKLRDYARSRGKSFWAAAIPIAYYGGGRRLKELVYLNENQIDGDYLDLSPHKTDTTTDGRRVRVHMHPALRDVITGLTADRSGYFFPEMIKKYEMDRNRPVLEFRKMCEAVGCYEPGVGTHSLRHSYVTMGIDAGIDEKAIAATAGHASVELTKRVYYHGIKDADISALPEL